MIDSIAVWTGLITGIAALISIAVFIYKRGQHDGELTSTVEMLEDIVPQMLEVQKGLSAVCQQISNHACDLDRGSAKMDKINRDIGNLRERVASIEARLDGM